MQVRQGPFAAHEPDGEQRVHIKIEAGRTSIQTALVEFSENTTLFSKFHVKSEAILGLGETLILSGLNQRERIRANSGVPVLRSIPILRLFFARRTVFDSNLAMIILLTLRDPAYVNERNRQEVAEFLDKRRALVEALQGTEEDMLRFEERYPDWRQVPPNRFASHTFLMDKSDLFRAFIGQDLTSEDLEFDPLATGLKQKRVRFWEKWN